MRHERSDSKHFKNNRIFRVRQWRRGKALEPHTDASVLYAAVMGSIPGPVTFAECLPPLS